MQLLTLVIPLFAGALAGGSLGCSVGVAAEPPVVTVPAAAGTVTVRWLMAGTADPSMCSVYGATSLELVVYDASAAVVATANESCASFSLSLALPEGTYSADATLVDPSGNARSVTKTLDAIDVVAGTDLAIDIDFPTSSIL